MLIYLPLVLVCCILHNVAEAFVVRHDLHSFNCYAKKTLQQQQRRFVVSTDDQAEDLDTSISRCLDILYEAAETKQAESNKVFDALTTLEKLSRQKAKADGEKYAQQMLQDLNGDWRLIFTTGTANTQKKLGGARINYFPLKAVQSFQTINETPNLIENGIYLGDWPALKFSGTMEFDLRKRQLQFDFTKLKLFDFFDITLGSGDAANLGAKTGLGNSSANLENPAKSKAFFNWISADNKIATARGAGGGLALWKRV
jgi:PAP_fibrillin